MIWRIVYQEDNESIDALSARRCKWAIVKINQKVRAEITDTQATSNPAVFVRFNGGSAFLLGAAIVAPPPHSNPFWMLVDPLGDVGLRI